MSLTSTYQLVDDLTASQRPSSDVVVRRLVDEAITSLAFAGAFATLSSSLTLTAGDPSLTLPTGSLRPLLLLIEGKWIPFTTIDKIAKGKGVEWRQEVGEPRVAYFDEDDVPSPRVWPIPSHDMSAVVVVAIAHSTLGAPHDPPSWLDLLIASEVISRDYAQETKYQDQTLSQMWGKVREVLLDGIALTK